MIPDETANATKRVEIAKARMIVVKEAKGLVQLMKQNDPEGEAEFLKALVEAVGHLNRMEAL